jgi:pyrimidine-nucleoside phosphorylase
MASLVELIAKKRDGLALNHEEIQRVISGYMAGDMADYQMSALLMAIFLRGLDVAETNSLTDAMLHSGQVLDLSQVPGTKVDKHSTGGVGDKVSICLAPLVAACGVPVPMVSGRGLGHTGGTLDKLEAIPGFRVDLETSRFAEIVADVGTSMIGQTRDIAPADKRIYALRDVTATVECIPLIVASILSKKLAEGIDALVMDVKVGTGAFMKSEAQARKLAEALVRVGKQGGKHVVALLTDMNCPLGLTIGNAIETREAIELLHGKSPSDLQECTLALAVEMLRLGGVAASEDQAREQLHQAIHQKKALAVMKRLVEAHSGDVRVVDEPDRLTIAPVMVPIKAKESGFLHSINPLELGLCAVELGAGRTRAEDSVDHAVGIELVSKPGATIQQGDTLAKVFVKNSQALGKLEQRLEQAFQIAQTPPAPLPLVLGRIDSESVLSNRSFLSLFPRLTLFKTEIEGVTR